MRRMSSLPILQFCGPSADLSAKHGAKRSAAISSAFHAKCAGSPDAEKRVALLTDDEREEMETWHVPTDIIVEGVELRYVDAEKELALGLDRFGFYADPEGPCLAVGHLDFAWAFATAAGAHGPTIAYVADIKRSRYTTPDGPDSLQLHAYARAYALLRGCDSYVTGIWAAEDGLWMWSPEIVHLDSDRGERLLDRILYAAGNTSTEFASGPHCQNCYSRLHCPEFSLPVHTGPSWIDALSGEDFSDKLTLLSPEDRGKLLVKLKALLAAGDAVLKQVNAAAERGWEFTLNGKTWAAKEMPGRRSLDKERLVSFLQGQGIAANEFDKIGQPYRQFGWQKL